MRFHFGVSFRLKTLKKFLFPILIGVLAYFGFGGFFGFFKVNALESYSTNSIITYEETSLMNSLIDDTHTYGEFFQNIVSLQGNGNGTYRLFAVLRVPYNTKPFIQLYLVKGNNIRPSYYINSSNALIGHIEFNTSGTSYETGFYGYDFTSQGAGHNVYESDFYTQFFSCYVTGDCTGNKLSTGITNDRYISPNLQIVYSSSSCSNSSDCYFNLNDSNTDTKTYIMASDLPMTIKNVYNTSSSSYLYKTLVINGVNYGIGDSFPTYFDLFPVISPTTIEGVQDYNDLFISNIPVANLGDLEFNFQFQTYTDSYYNLFSVRFYKKIDNGTYYSYEEFSCNNVGLTMNSVGSFYTGTLSNISGCGSLSDSTEVFIQIIPPSSSYGKPISEFTYTLNYGYFSIIPIFNGNGTYRIMEHVVDFPANQNLVLSTTYDWAYSYIKTDSRYLLSCEFNNSSGVATGYCENPFQFGTSYSSKSNIIYNYLPENNNTTTFDLFFSDDVIISQNTNNSSITYYDNTGSLTSQVVNNLHQVNSSAYDVDDLFTRVNNYIDSLKDDITSIHDLLEQCFYSLDSSIQLIIIILYILTLSYLLFKVIRR